MITDLWDQTRIAREFGVSLSTVQTSWRNATITAVREHVQRCGLDVETTLGGPVAALTQARWDAVRRVHAVPPLRLPNAALPLPDVVMGTNRGGTRPGWTERTMRAWAVDTDRVDPVAGYRKAKSPGRPVGIVETKPRARRAG